MKLNIDKNFYFYHLEHKYKTVGVQVDLLTRSEQQTYQTSSNIQYDHVGHPPTPAFTLALTRKKTGGALE